MDVASLLHSQSGGRSIGLLGLLVLLALGGTSLLGRGSRLGGDDSLVNVGLGRGCLHSCKELKTPY